MNNRRKPARLAAAFMVAVLAFFVPLWALAYTSVPVNGLNRLIDIFPGPDSPELAEDIAAQIGAPDTNYAPSSASEFDLVTTISLPNSDVKYIYGIEHCANLINLLVPGNYLTDDKLDVLADAPLIRYLDLSRNQLTPRSLPYIAHLPLDILNLSGNKFTAENLEALPASVKNLNVSNNDIGDAGATKIAARLTSLTKLNLSGAGITDDGAATLAGMPGRGGIDIILYDNHLGSVGMRAILGAGFKSLDMRNQSLTATGISDGRRPVVHSIIVNPADIDPGSISDGGKYDPATGKITWPARNTDAEFTYGYMVDGHGGVVYVPFAYKAFVYKVKFIDGVGGQTLINVDDQHRVTAPKDPERKGFIFTGWTLTKGGGDYFDFSTPITGDLTLYAGWTKNVEDSGEGNDEDEGDGDGDGSSGGRITGNGGSSPDTGDATPVCAWFMMGAFAFFGLSISVALRVKETARIVPLTNPQAGGFHHERDFTTQILFENMELGLRSFRSYR